MSGDFCKTCFVFPDADEAGVFNVTMTQPNRRPLKYRLDWHSAARLQKQLADAVTQMQPPPEKYFQK